MKKSTKICIITLAFIAAFLTVVICVPISVNAQTTSHVPTQVIIHDRPPVFLMLSRIDDKTPTYEFNGTLVFDTFFNIQALTIYSPSDSTQLRTTFINRAVQSTDDYTIEIFAFGIHGGALRRQIEKAGRCIIMIHGIDKVLSFDMTEYGETMLLTVLIKPKVDVITKPKRSI